MKITPAVLAQIVDRPLSETVTIDLKGKEITHIDDISACIQLRKLDLSNNSLKSSESLGGIRNVETLVHLNVAGNSLDDISFIEYLTKLNVFNVSNNNLMRIHRTIGRCTELKALILSHNNIKRIENIGKLTNLNTIVISHNKLEEIPDLPLLKELTKLSAAHNQIRTIPNLTLYPKLKEIRFNDNKITSIPDEIRLCPSLKVIDLGNNLLSEWASIASLSSLLHLDNLNLKGNPICKKDNYREKILKIIPTLRILDGKRFDERFLKRKEKRKILDEIKEREAKERELGLPPGSLKPDHIKKRKKQKVSEEERKEKDKKDKVHQ